MIDEDCLFCRSSHSASNIFNGRLCYAAWDSYPVGEGHALIIPHRHVADYFDVSKDEQLALWSMVDRVRDLVIAQFQPDGFNVGINVGQAAGQSILHLHIHLIPRYKGDVENPQGGVRGVIPNKQKY